MSFHNPVLKVRPLNVHLYEYVSKAYHTVMFQTDQNPTEQAGIERATVRLWPEAGRRLGLGRAATYAAAQRGEIPVLKFGRKLLVPTAKLEKLVGAA